MKKKLTTHQALNELKKHLNHRTNLVIIKQGLRSKSSIGQQVKVYYYNKSNNSMTDLTYCISIVIKAHYRKGQLLLRGSGPRDYLKISQTIAMLLYPKKIKRLWKFRFNKYNCFNYQIIQ